MTDGANSLANREIFDARSSPLEMSDDERRVETSQTVVELWLANRKAPARWEFLGSGCRAGAAMPSERRMQAHPEYKTRNRRTCSPGFLHDRQPR